MLREITATGADVDPREYQVDEYPATQAALRAGTMVEAHVDDPHSDPAERALLARDGFASLLVTPVIDEGTPLGILEFSSYTHHRWTRRDLVQARTVADHLAGTLRRLGDAEWPTRLTSRRSDSVRPARSGGPNQHPIASNRAFVGALTEYRPRQR